LEKTCAKTSAFLRLQGRKPRQQRRIFSRPLRRGRRGKSASYAKYRMNQRFLKIDKKNRAVTSARQTVKNLKSNSRNTVKGGKPFINK